MSHVAYDLVYTLIRRISSRVFIGAPTCYDQAWIEAVNRFPEDVEKVKLAVLPLPSFLRSWIAPLTPQRRRIAQDHRKVRNILFPSSRLQKSKEEFTVLNFLLDSSKDHDTDTLTSRMILLTAAAVSSTHYSDMKKL